MPYTCNRLRSRLQYFLLVGVMVCNIFVMRCIACCSIFVLAYMVFCSIFVTGYVMCRCMFVTGRQVTVWNPTLVSIVIRLVCFCLPFIRAGHPKQQPGTGSDRPSQKADRAQQPASAQQQQAAAAAAAAAKQPAAAVCKPAARTTCRPKKDNELISVKERVCNLLRARTDNA